MSTIDLLIEYYPLLIAAVSSLLYLKPLIFKNKTNGIQFLANKLLQNTFHETISTKINENTKKWLKRTSEINRIIDSSNIQKNEPKTDNFNNPNIELTIWQNVLLIWILFWVGLTAFIFFNIFTDPIWKNYWTVLPYFIYNVISGTIYFLKRGN